ncbi:alpha/beta fold hydrolase [Staphylococcus haemolyticus]|uniref:alpha/beta fold hydrolase n=1 Tax=Staphylococcus haemolyticus TaxID=1283 RepID=UPI000D1DE9AA|nr:alpha/beta hydrolase [Staphylococcus haemolyticus]MBU6947617.1 alpha/beta hydrolase [Staphylococcus haemolyticus]MBU7212463.1 alpha/beta hydrolase [Staphylococcus haemolyticus]PTK55954.1 alpha/beta hydrolase [Staphylococcus haemolyticus]PTK69564.1 alpha/beta hydrolase [Staphylococcus haemolyticus]PTL03633.1 alpha/beta hydrolase [Staphylococcus haemolyticus]
MNRKHFKTQIYQLKNYHNEQVEVAFAGNQTSNRAIVFLHGAIMTYRIMTMFEPYFREYKMIFINCPSRGKSSSINRNNHTLDDYSERIEDVLEQIVSSQHLEKVMVIGYSMGGMIGTRLLKFNTLPISHLVYLSSAAKITPNTSMLARLFSTDSKRDYFKDEITAIKNLPQYILKKTVYARKENGLDILSFVASIKTIITDLIYTIKADYLPDIEEIEQFPKLLFISGKDDEIIPYTDSQATMEQYKRYGGETKEIVYPGIGHMDFPSVLEQLPNGTVGIVDHIKDWIEDK